MSETNKLEVGQKLYLYTLGEVIITRIGRKYFEVVGEPTYQFRDKKFEINTLRYENKEYNQYKTQLYKTKEEVQQLRLHDGLCYAINKKFGPHDNPLRKIPSDKLLIIAEILGIDTKEIYHRAGINPE